MRTQINRLLILIFLSFLTHSQAHALTCKEVFNERDPQKQARRTRFIKENVDFILRTRSQNQAWINRAILESSEGIHLEITAPVKVLNDVVLKNKDLVTAFLNAKKVADIEAITESLGSVANGGIGRGSEVYSDFKTIRIFLPTSRFPAQKTIEIVEAAFTKANENFMAELKEMGIFRPDLFETHWFFMGIAKNADMASYAARKAQQRGEPIFNLFNPSSQRLAKADFEAVKAHLEALNVHRDGVWRDWMFDKETSGLLNVRVLELYRKYKGDIPTFVDVLKGFRGYEVSGDFLAEVVRFLDRIDLFSPSLLIAERTTVNVESAPHGILSIDFVGLGARNLMATMEAVVQARTFEEVMPLAREKEAELTRQFDRDKDAITQAAKDFFDTTENLTRFSGDEGAIVFPSRISNESLLNLQKALYEAIGTGSLRLTVIPSKPAPQKGIDAELINLAEGVEKNMALQLGEKIPPQLLLTSQLNIRVTYGNGLFTPAAGPDSLMLTLYVYGAGKHSQAQRDYIKKIFQETVLEKNWELKEQVLEFNPISYGLIEN